MTSSNKFSALKCVLLDKSLSKVINSFLPPQQVYPDIQKKKDKVINSLKGFYNNQDDDDYCYNCKVNLRIWLNLNDISKTSWYVDEYFICSSVDYESRGLWCYRCAIKYYDNLSFRVENYKQLRDRVERCHKAEIYL